MIVKKPKKVIPAGGVIVRSQNNTVQVLLYREKGYEGWILPKGHVEAGETLENAARREVLEEVGVTDVFIHDLLGTFQRYVESTNENKTIHYFLMTTNPDEPKGSPEDADTEIAWFPIEELSPVYISEQKQVIHDNLGKIKGIFNVLGKAE